jgi:hypothetical protein
MINTLKDEDMSLSKRLKELSKLRDSIKQLSKRYSPLDFTDSRSMYLGVDPHKLIRLDRVDSALNPQVDYNAIKDFLFKKGVDWLKQWFQKRTLKEFFKMQKKLDKIGEHAKLIKKVWDYELTKSDVRRLAGFTQI